MVEPQEYPKEVTLKNDLRALQEAVGGRIDIIKSIFILLVLTEYRHIFVNLCAY